MAPHPVALGSLDGTTGFRLDGIDVNDQSGRSVSSAGDVNGDGFDDVIIGARHGDPSGKDNAVDRTRMLNNSKNFLSRATVDNLHDTNRDSLVNAVDRTVALNNSTTFVTDPNRFTVPNAASAGSASVKGSRMVYRSQHTLIDAMFGSIDGERGLFFDI